MTDEISGAIGKIPDLRVVGRSSAFQYKDRNVDLREIGQELNATHIVEGSLRKAGDRVRITAQLIQAEDGLQIWTENYDRELTDVFAIQEEVAQAVASTLGRQIGLVPGTQLVSSRTDDLESYEQFLRLREMFRGRINIGLDRVQTLPGLEVLVERNPDFAPARGLLAMAYLDFPAFDVRMMRLPSDITRDLMQERLDKAELAASEALRLDARQVNVAHSIG